MPPQRNSDNMVVRLVLLFLVLTFSLGLCGYLCYDNQHQQVNKNIQDELSAIADLKVNQIVAWRNERIGDAQSIVHSKLIVSVIGRFMKHPDDPDLRQDILGWMQSLRENFDFKDILIVDTQGTVRLSTSPREREIGQPTTKRVKDALRTHGVVLSDIEPGVVTPSVHLDLIVPLLMHKKQGIAPLGAIVVRVDPESFLFPVIQAWPGARESAETVLIRREGGEVVFLNELRHRRGTVLSLRIPLGKTQALAALLDNGGNGVLEIRDYRDVPVLAAVRTVPGTPWFLIAKIDREEIDAPIRRQVGLLSVVVFSLILVCGLSIIFWWRQRTSDYLRRELAAELERQTLSQQYDSLSRNANDIILLLDPDGRIVEANDRALSSYGYRREELLHLSVRDIHSPETASDVDTEMIQVREQNGFIFETIHRRRNGTTFPVEVSSRVIMDGEKPFCQSIIRDISDRKHTERLLRESQLFLQTIIDTEPECVKLLAADGSLLMMNKAGLEMIQADSLDQVKGMSVTVLVSPEYKNPFINLTKEVFDGKSGTVEFEMIGLKGKRLWLETHAVPLRDEKKQIKALLSITRDITERKETEKKIQHVTRLYAVMSQVNQTIVRARDRHVLFQNICRIAVEYGGFRLAWIGMVDKEAGTVRPVAHSGFAEEYLDELSVPVAHEPEGRSPVGTAIREGKRYVSNDLDSDPAMDNWRERAARRGYHSLGAFPIVVRNAVVGSFNIYSPEKDFFNNDEIRLLTEVTLDISFALENMEREDLQRQVEVALINEKNKSEAILAAIGDGISVQDTGFKILYQNQVHKDMMGDHVGKYCYQAYEHNDAICNDCPVALSMQDGQVHTTERVLPSGKEIRFFEITSSPLKDETGNIIAGIEAVREITGRKRIERAAIESERRYKRLVESITDYIYTVEVREGRAVATYHGPGCVAVTGYSPGEYRADPDLLQHMIFEEDRSRVFELANKIATGAAVTPFEHRIIHKDGSLHWVRHTPVPRFGSDGKVVAYDGLITDITQVKLLENQLRQAQKMEAVGQLAGGIAHDFNNILTAIIGYGNLLMLKMKGSDPGRTYVEQILSSSERAAQLTRSLLAFSRKQVMDLKPVSMNSIIRSVEKLLVRVIGEDIEFRTVLSSDDPFILADSIQIEHVLMNLSTNARDAMPNGGTLQVETASVELGEKFVRSHSYAKPGRYVLISVADTGIGMEETVRSRVFEPFFTTKELGKGTGLGLAMVYGIIKQHNGYIHVESKPGRGTTFKIYLPMIESAAHEKFEREMAEIPRGSETVLLAEDDISVRQLTKNMLEDFGYTVIEAVDGEDAVRKFRENKDRIALLLFDIVMPKKNGREAYYEIKKIRSDVKALFTSGYTADIVQKKGIIDTGMEFILKPSTPTVFLQKVREVLNKE